MADDPFRYFRLEARELLDQFGTAILALDKNAAVGGVQRMLRLAHTLKGAARVVKQPEIADSAHAIEDELTPFRDGDGAVPRDRIAAVQRQLDEIDSRVRALEAPAVAVPREPDAMARPDIAEPHRSVRADLADVDAVLDSIAETHAATNGLHASLHALQQARHIADVLTEQLGPAATGTTHALADDLRRAVGGIERQLGATADHIDRELRQLRGAAEQMRLVSAATLIAVLERTARDAAHALAKEIVFEAHGGDVKLGADLLATAQAALVQMVRNAVAHGIEPAGVRRAAGKQAAGRITLDISRRGDRLVFSCSDDGGGIDLDAVRRTASRRGLPADAAGRLDVQELMNLLLRGGVSTSASVTEIAGRGIGLDVARDAAERLGGAVQAVTEAGRGTTFELVVPLSLTSVEALIVEAGATRAAVPLDAIRATMLLDANAVSRDPNGATILYRQRAIPFLWLPLALAGERLPAGRKWPAVVVAGSDGMAAIGVDRLHGTLGTVVLPLPELTSAGPMVAGAFLDTAGDPHLVLSPTGLVGAARQRDAAAPEPAPVRRPVLVIDDSLTTRMLEQSILESAGYKVDVAVSGEDALAIARRERYSLFLVDVEMPGMDGFTFIERTQADPALRDIPAVLVTSRAAPEDIRRGRDAGARGYIVKGQFDQSELLATIRSLIG